MPTNDSKSFDDLDRESLQSIGKALEKHFPQDQETTELVLLEVSPHRLHAYWHITAEDLAGVLSTARDPQARLVIRFLEQGTPDTAFDVELTETSGRRYVELPQDAKRYAGELGLRIADGRLLPLARSNIAELPRSGQSSRAGSRVLTLTPLESGFFQPPVDINRSNLGGFHRRWQENTDQPTDLTLFDSGVRLYPEFPNPLLGDSVPRPLRLPAYQRLQALSINPPASQAQLTGRLPDPTLTGDPLVTVPPWPLAREFPLSPIEALTWDPAYDLPAGILTWPSAPLPPWPGELPMPRPVDISEPALGSVTSSFPGSSAQPLSSFEPGIQLQVEPDTELHMELHIHGHKPPDGPYMLFGQPIPTDEQGNFSLTRVLPPDTQPLVAQLLAALQGR